MRDSGRKLNILSKSFWFKNDGILVSLIHTYFLGLTIRLVPLIG